MAGKKVAAQKAAPKTKAKKQEEPKEEISLYDQRLAQLSGIKAGGVVLLDLFKEAEQFTDMEVETFPTGFPQLDRVFHPRKPGFPLSRHGEISSAAGNAGKSTWIAQVIAAAQQYVRPGQQYGLACALAEPEGTHTESYLNSLGVVTRFDPSRPHIIPVRFMRPTWDRTSQKTLVHSAENYLNAIGAAADVFDLIVIDSVAALESQANLDKEADDHNGVGGISKLLNEFFRRYPRPRAACAWINQQRDKVGAYSPGGPPPKVNPGGNALLFYTTWRIFITRVETIKSTTDGEEPIGFRSNFFFKKNKLGPPDRTVQLPLIHEEGFSIPFAIFEFAEKNGVIDKNGAWYQYPKGDAKKDKSVSGAYGFLRAQGRNNFYYALRERPDTLEAIKAVLKGEDPEDLRPEGDDFQGVTLEGDVVEDAEVRELPSLPGILGELPEPDAVSA